MNYGIIDSLPEHIGFAWTDIDSGLQSSGDLDDPTQLSKDCYGFVDWVLGVDNNLTWQGIQL